MEASLSHQGTPFATIYNLLLRKCNHLCHCWPHFKKLLDNYLSNWWMNTTPMPIQYRVSQKKYVSLWQLVSPLLQTLLEHPMAVLNCSCSLVFKDLEDWPKNDRATAENVMITLEKFCTKIFYKRKNWSGLLALSTWILQIFQSSVAETKDLCSTKNKNSTRVDC